MAKLSFFRVISVLILLLLVLAGCNGSNVKDSASGESVIGQDYYLKVNVWYMNPGKIMSTNYHGGSMLAAGRKFKITDLGRIKIRFADDKGMEYTIIHKRKHTAGDLQTVFDQYFSKKDVTKSEAFNKFTAMEKEQIRKGEIIKGMSKDAVIMAYGYPPTHRTPSLESDRWLYWGNTWGSRAATFENGKLVSYGKD